MAEHPVRIRVDDDLRRSRLTVLFRLLLAIPHVLWWNLWSFFALFVAIAIWLVTLVRGTPPPGLYTLQASYVRYSTHFFAYLLLAANPWPMFTGRPGYPIDLDFDPPQRQRRLTVAFRLILSVPVLLLAVCFTGGGFLTYGGGIVLTVAFFAWFACLVRGQMPSGFRDLQAYGLRYLAQVFAYLFVLTERYPDVDPAATPASGREHPVWLAIDEDLRRSRLTVFFRLFLSLPHIVWLLLWTVVAIPTAFVTWLAALVIGRPPRALHRFLSAWIRYSTHLYAYLTLAANPFPGFTGAAGSYPLDPVFPAPERQHRLVTAFRIFLAIPALAVSGAVGLLIIVGALFGWFVALALGRMPASLRNAQAYALRYSAQVSAYVFLLTDRYPYSGAIRIPSRS